LKCVVDARRVLDIVPAEIISAYVPYRGGLDLESAALVALERDEKAAETLRSDVLSME